jgi:hypothetical protein
MLSNLIAPNEKVFMMKGEFGNVLAEPSPVEIPNVHYLQMILRFPSDGANVD